MLNAGYLEDELVPHRSGHARKGIASPALAKHDLGRTGSTARAHFPGSRSMECVPIPRSIWYDMPMTFIITGAPRSNWKTKSGRWSSSFCWTATTALTREDRITHISQGFDLPGTAPPLIRCKLIIQPSKEEHARVLEKVRALIKANSTAAQAALIEVLNRSSRRLGQTLSGTCRPKQP